MAERDINLRRRYRKEAQFKWFGRAAIAFSVMCIAGILLAILYQSTAALRVAYLVADIEPQALEYDAFGNVKINDELVPQGLLSVYAPSKVIEMNNADQSQYAYLLSNPANRYLKDPTDISAGVTESQKEWLDKLAKTDRLDWRFNRYVFQNGNSSHPEFAGVWGSFKGSLLALLLAVVLAFPLGVAAAVYLEEFAPSNRWTHLLEVNINNLAAIPSIVYGLLGLALFINVFHVPRAVPLIGGLVLAMMMLPVVIISSRASLLAVPIDLRYAAIGVGASRQQVVLHHVLPQAFPRILTGLLLAIGNLVGEAAPLLTLGMVAFFADIPDGLVDPATALPVQIYMWSVSADATYMEAAATGILLLLVVLVLINVAANGLRRWFEKRLEK